MNIYYVYQYIREDSTPYYIGKGKLDRAWVSHKRSNGADIKPKDDSKIQILYEHLSEKEAFDLEKKLIQQYGLKQDGGSLVNLTYGGDGQSPSQEVRDVISKKLTGTKKPPRSNEHKKNLSESCKGIPKPRSEEHQKVWTESSKKNWVDNLDRKKQVSELGKLNKGRKHTPEALEKKRQSMLKYWEAKRAQVP